MKQILIAVAVAVAATSAFGASLCNNGTNSVDVYSNATLNAGTVLSADTTDTCTVDGTTFSNFEVAGGAGDNFVSDFNFSVIAVNPGEIEFSYSNLGTGDIELYYTMTPTDGMILQNGTSSAVTEIVCDAAYAAPNSTCTGNQLNLTALQTSSSPNVPQSFSVLAPPTNSSVDYVVKDISGGSENFQDPVPEPMTLSLMGIGLLGIGFLGRRVRK